VLKAAQPWVDVLSFQFFASPGEVAKSFTRFSDLTGKPTLLADASIPGSIPEQTQWGPRYSGNVANPARTALLYRLARVRRVPEK